MPQRIIHFFEMVQIYKHHGRRSGQPLAVGKRFFQPYAQHAPVGQSGELVKMRLLPDVRF